MQDKLYILPAEQPEQAYKSNLPVQFTPLIDREQEVSAVCTLLGRPDVRLLTLTGPPGIGKTRLALQVATELIQDFTDGIFFVPLAPISDPAFVAPAIALAFELKEAGNLAMFDLLQVYLEHKHLLLLLDNFEQILLAAPLLAQLLTACPGLKILMTSREALRLRGEHQYLVPPLEVPDPRHCPDIETLAQHAAVALFLQRAQAIKPNFALTPANAQAITEICRRLDGLPLAIELAAARIKVLSPQSLLARLEHRLQVLTHGPQDLPERQQTLRKTIQWSYDLLRPEEQRLFRRLSVFAGGCTIGAAEAICIALDNANQAIPVLDQVTSLFDKSLLQQSEQEDEEPRFVMLETIHEYGLEALAACGELEATRQAHADYYLALAEEAESLFKGPQEVVWLERLEREHDNLRTAMQWLIEREDRREMALRLGAALRRFWFSRGYLSEGRTFLEHALTPGEQVIPVAAPVRAKALIAVARLVVNQGDYDRGEMLCEECLALCRELGDTRGTAYSLYMLAWVAWARGNLALARSQLEQSLRLYREVGDRENIAYDLYELAYVIRFQGEYARARSLLEESLAMQREQENKSGIANSLSLLAQVLFASHGDFAMVRSLLAESLMLFRELGEKESIVDSLVFSGRLALSQGDAARARSLLEESVALYKEMGHRWGTAESLSVLAGVLAVQGDLATARTLYEESLALAKEIGYQLWIAPCLEGLAGVIAAQGEPEWAARLWGAAETLRESMGAPMPPVERTTYEQAVASARRQAGEEVFAAAWAEGRTMRPEQALAAQGQATMPSSLLDRSALASPAKAFAAHSAGLTTREMEVLHLLAKGLTSAQIAEQLTLSLLTVNTHVRSIYSKLGVTSRSAATRWAIEHQLV